MFKTIILFFALIFTFSIFNAHCSLLHAQSWQALIDSTKFYQEKQDFGTALKWVELALPQAEKEFGKMDTNYASTLGSATEIFYYLGNLDSAIYYGDLQVTICRKIFKTVNIDLASCINNLGLFYKDQGNFKKADTLYREALDMIRHIYKGDHPDLATSIYNMASFYFGRGDFKNAELLQIEALEMRRRILKNDHPDLATSINSMAVLYKGKGDFKNAEPLYIEALEIRRHIFKTDHPDLATSINNMATFYDDIGDFIKAEPLFIEALEMRRRIYKTDHRLLAGSINNMAMFYKGRGNFLKAEPLLIEALCMSRRIFKTDHKDLAVSINNMALFYNDKGDFKNAEPLYIEALKMLRRIFKSDHPLLANSINNMAVFYDDRGDFKNAEPLFIEALEMYRRIFKTDNPYLAMSINSIAYFYYGRCDYKKAEPLYIEALEMRRRIYKNDHNELAESIYNMALLYKAKGDLKKSEPLLIEVLEMNRRMYKIDHPNLARSINSMALFYNANGNFKRAETLYLEALGMYRRIFKTDHPLLAKSINYMADFFYDRVDFKNAEMLYLEALEMYKNILNNYFPSLSENEKEQFFNTFSGYYKQFNDFSVSRYKESPKLLETMYDNQLLTKGMLLSASNKVRSSIISSNDTSLIELFKSWKDKKEFISKLYQMSNAQLKKKRINLDSIVNIANDLEKELTKRSELFKNEYDKQKLTWEDVQNRLQSDEAVVEIVRINYLDKKRTTDTVYYAALIVTSPPAPSPSGRGLRGGVEFVLLENGKDLEGKFLTSYNHSIRHQLKDEDSYKQFWKPISNLLSGFKKVYVSPDGVYNQINLATLRNPESGRYLLDEKEIVVIGSSRDLVKRKIDSPTPKNDNLIVELFGNPKFNLDSIQHQQLASNFKNENKAGMERGLMDSLTTRGGIAQLPGTRTEIDNIYSLFKTKEWDVRKHLGEDALEEAVKTVSNPRVLHIATHGMFLNDIERAKDDDRTFGMDTKRFVENPLLRSMLLFSGAENTITKKDENNSLSKIDDGLLTAYEAMNLNLDKTELVVLSACETGLGTIKNGEGVYGLQRAFIQAGAKSLIMSLWKVNDQTTQELMTKFYTKWIAGKTKRQAFKEAQQEIKKKYKEPYYWGAFVMVGE